jgi:hypothetical protein
MKIGSNDSRTLEEEENASNMKRMKSLLLLNMIMVLLSGCLYPGGGSNSGMATGEYTILVENAVITYKSRTGVLPIYNSMEDTPIYEKYRVDFQKLLDYKLLSQVPADAFEKGGYYYYMIVEPEGELSIKLMDVRVSQAVADVQRLVDNYMLSVGKLPLGKSLSSGYYVLDFEKLGKKQQQQRSVYSETYLIYLLHESGRVFLDYAPEIMKAIQAGDSVDLGQLTDLRQLLIEQTPLIPVASSPYVWENEAPMVKE